jgi:hypothetical protein
MPKLSRASASPQGFPGYSESYEQEFGDWTVSIERDFVDMDLAPFFKGAPDDECQAHHLGYVVAGTFSVRHHDGVMETFEAGDAFVIEPGHIPVMSAGGEFVAFTPTSEAREQTAVMMPNILRYAREHGIELPGMATSA